LLPIWYNILIGRLMMGEKEQGENFVFKRGETFGVEVVDAYPPGAYSMMCIFYYGSVITSSDVEMAKGATYAVVGEAATMFLKII